MYNLRYHIASLVSVFLALAVGLILGTVVVERGLLDAQKRTLVQSLQDEFRSLSTQNDSLRDDAESMRTLAKQTVDYVVAGEMSGKTVAIVGITGRSDAAAAAQSAVQAAGGTAVIVTVRKPDGGLGEDDVDAAIESVLRGRREGPATVTVDATSVASVLAAEWASGEPRPLTRAIQGAEALGAEGLRDGVAVDALLVVASSEETADPLAVAIASAMAARGLPVAGVEVTTQETKAADAAVDAGLPAVDHADLPDGVVSLVWVLSRGVKGHFGVDEGAVGRFPEIRR